MANSGGLRQPTQWSRPAIAALAALGLLIAACGGGSGGGGGGNFVIRVAFANQTDAPATLQMADGEPVEVESCRGGVFTFPMPETDWVLTVNGETAIDSLEQDPQDIDNNVAARLWLREDGTTELESLLPGSNITPPATLSICT